MLIEGNQHICVFVRQFDLAYENMYISVSLQRLASALRPSPALVSEQATLGYDRCLVFLMQNANPCNGIIATDDVLSTKKPPQPRKASGARCYQTFRPYYPRSRTSHRYGENGNRVLYRSQLQQLALVGGKSSKRGASNIRCVLYQSQESLWFGRMR